MRDYYQEMLDGTFREDGYGASADKSWLSLIPSAPYQHSGWKFRLSVHPDDIKKAWNITAHLLMADGHTHVAKVAHPSSNMIMISTKAGVKPERYISLMQIIEERLRAMNIRPGPAVAGDRKVPGALFLSYKNDIDANGGYNDAKNNTALPEAQRYNPAGFADPYASFNLQPSQPSHPSLDGLMLRPWQQAQTSRGKFITRLRVTPDEAEDVIGKLSQQGYTPQLHESKALGLVVRLDGDDALNYMKKKMETTQDTQLGQWRPAFTNGNVAIARMRVSPEQKKTVIDALERQGFHPELRESKTLGLTLRLRGNEALQIMKMQELHEEPKAETSGASSAPAPSTPPHRAPGRAPALKV